MKSFKSAENRDKASALAELRYVGKLPLKSFRKVCPRPGHLMVLQKNRDAP